MKFVEQNKIKFSWNDDGLWQKRLDIIDKYTNDRGTHILELIKNYLLHHDDYYDQFRETANKHLLLEYDAYNIAYIDEKLGVEFTFLHYHHSCSSPYSYAGIIDRMARELQGVFLSARNELKILGEDSIAYKQFNEEYGDILNFPYFKRSEFYERKFRKEI